MGETVNKLQLVDAEQLNRLISLLEKKGSDDRISRDAVASPEQLELVDSYKRMQNSVENKSSQAKNDIVNFMRKKRKCQDTLQPRDNDDEGEVGERVPRDTSRPARKAKPIRSGVEEARKKISVYLKGQGVRRTPKGINYAGKTFNISYQDVMNDLTHNYKRKETNLSVAKTSEALKILKKTRMPASFIKNEAIKKKYKDMDTEGESSSSSDNVSSSVGTSSYRTPEADSLLREIRGTLSTPRQARSRTYLLSGK